MNGIAANFGMKLLDVAQVLNVGVGHGGGGNDVGRHGDGAMVKAMFEGTITVSADIVNAPAVTNSNVEYLGNIK